MGFRAWEQVPVQNVEGATATKVPSVSEVTNTSSGHHLSRDTYSGGAGEAAAPFALIHGEQERQELPFILSSFRLSYRLYVHFPAFWTVWLKIIFPGSRSPDPKLCNVVLGDQYIKHCFSGKSVTTKIYSSGGLYTYIDVRSGEA